MRRIVAYAIVFIAVAAAGAWLSAETPPEKSPEAKPALPPGHPTIPPSGGLPPGHPPMTPGSGGMPAGHPQITPGGSGMPPGHPPISTAVPDADVPPPDSKSTLVAQAVQGTPNGPVAKGDQVVVVLIHNDKPVNRIEAALDDKGQAILENLPVGGGVQPLVTVKHGDVTYWGIGEPMHAGPPDHRVTITVYEPTEEPTPWVIRARHILVRRTEEGLYVREILAVENTGDKAWIGRKGDDGKRVTLSLRLSPNNGRVAFGGGFPEGGAEFLNGNLVSHTPLRPGKAQFQFAYVIPVSEGKAGLDIACPADTEQLILAVPEDGSKVNPKGMGSAEVMSMGQTTKVRLYKAENAKAGAAISASFTDIPLPLPALPATPAK
ncbi:MAG: hypothetical protein NT049_11685 [Planctomycetota bacterium]|nr:hypothetical protein [Planctomycetota bacterium]